MRAKNKEPRTETGMFGAFRSASLRRFSIVGALRCFALVWGLPFLCITTAFSQRPTPAPPQQKSILITGATLHIGNGTLIENGAIGFRGGKIDFVGTAGSHRVAYDSVITATGKHVYPGFILPATPLGLNEVDAVRATHDFAETGGINPSVRALVGYNTDSKLIPTIRSNGVLYAQIVPRGGLVSGTSSVVQLDAWNWEDAAIRTDDGIWFNWPPERFNTGWWAEAGEDEPNKKRKEQLEQLTLLLQRAKAFNHETVDLNLSALQGLFNGSRTAYIQVGRAKEIKEAVLFFREIGVQNVVVCGGEESHLVADFLKAQNVPVLLERLHALPNRADDAYDLPYALPKLLQDAGVVYALTYTGNMEVMGSRNLPFLAGTAVRLGLTKEQALQSITLNAARILGIDEACGSLEVGKHATLFLSTGDALDMLTHNVEAAFIQGRGISLENHQKELYERYKQKYNIK